MKKQSIMTTLAAGLLTWLALSACTLPDTSAPSDTEGDTTVVTVTDTTPATDAGTEDTATAVPDETTFAESETHAPETDGAVETDTATKPADSDTKPVETEAVTAPPRYDYMGAEVLPDVTIDESVYTDMKLTLPSYLQVTEADVKAYIEYIRFDYRTPDNGTAQVTDAAMKLGDDAFIYYKGMINGEEFEGGSNWDDAAPYQLGLGSGSFIPGFESGLVGVIPKNATKENPAEVRVTFPENYGNDLAGREAVFYVAVEYAVQYSLPTYDRKFVEETLQYEAEKDFYASDKALLTEFENYVRTYLEEEKAADVENAKVDALWDYLTGSAVCQNLPAVEVEYYLGSYIAEIEYYYDYYKSYAGESFTKEYPTIDDFGKVYVGVEDGGDWRATLRGFAENIVKKDMICHAIAEREDMETVTDEEYKAELKYWVDYYQGYMSEAEILANMGEATLRESAFAEKMQAWLMARATFTFETAE